ncbi:MetQ/NlpA family ABC transporter substrate-binding protein [uncultured Ferrovibrio sp.]|jgi:D-methionine transport system substrate-binding protein|uniref:MetQ/NlpA family ABC transporter substrate-binding protein n=1 Tax=uncultured Ferrovibrio sp. TaxID=1576913 RepID=UPI002634A5DF|nr:MetQ/NlpA family ABC transporter substrate-binding protein [uncultured Ferrovibrio sp.]
MSFSLFRRSLAVLGLAALIASPAALAQDKPIKVGVTAGPHAEIMEVVKQVAEKDGLKIQIVEFSDYVQPNAALNAGDLDANSYQHLPYLEAQIKDRGYKLTNIAYTVNFPMGVYSKKVKSLDELPNGARVGIPNDPTNGARGLLVLESAGLIKLREGAGLKASPLDVAENPKKIRIVELDAAQLPRALAELDAAAINTNYAIPAGLSPTKDAIASEGAKAPYVNIIAVRTAEKDRPEFAKLVKAYQSPEVKAFVEQKYQKAIVTAW